MTGSWSRIIRKTLTKEQLECEEWVPQTENKEKVSGGVEGMGGGGLLICIAVYCERLIAFIVHCGLGPGDCENGLSASHGTPNNLVLIAMAILVE